MISPVLTPRPLFILASTGPRNMAAIITPIAQTHAASFHACLDVVARERKYLLLLQAPPLAQVERYVADNIAQSHVQVVALAGPTVVGWADILPGWTETVAHVGKLGMGLLPAFRGVGLGTQLLAAAIAKARDQGIDRIELGVRIDNATAAALYRKLGFVEEGYRRHAVKVDGKYIDELAMALWVG